MKWEYKIHYQALVTKVSLTKNLGIENYEKNIKESEKNINNIAKEGWELFSSHVTAFNMMVFIFRRSKN